MARVAAQCSVTMRDGDLGHIVNLRNSSLCVSSGITDRNVSAGKDDTSVASFNNHKITISSNNVNFCIQVYTINQVSD